MQIKVIFKEKASGHWLFYFGNNHYNWAFDKEEYRLIMAGSKIPSNYAGVDKMVMEFYENKEGYTVVNVFKEYQKLCN